jgi:selenide, water dikinase
MLDASGVGARVGEVPVIEGVTELLEAGYYPGGSERNLESVRPRVKGDLERLSLLADAQTSGGLLVAVPDRGLDRYLEAVPAAVVIGEFTACSGEIVLT